MQVGERPAQDPIGAVQLNERADSSEFHADAIRRLGGVSLPRGGPADAPGKLDCELDRLDQH